MRTVCINQPVEYIERKREQRQRRCKLRSVARSATTGAQRFIVWSGEVFVLVGKIDKATHIIDF